MERVIPTVFSQNITQFDQRLSIATDISEAIHIDFMDGVFVPATSLEPENLPSLPQDKHYIAHLMVKNPDAYLHALERTGFSVAIGHIETLQDPRRFLEHARAHGMRAYLAKHAETPISELLALIEDVDGVLLMGIHAGREGQAFQDHVLEEIGQLRKKRAGLHIEIDGGVNEDVSQRLGMAGASSINSGSYITHAENPSQAKQRLETAFRNGHKRAADPSTQLRLLANTIRQHIIRMLAKSGSGHSAGPLGMADVFAALYGKQLRVDPQHPDAPERDYLFLSNGHICPVQYAALAEARFFLVEELDTLRTLGSRLQGHPHNGSLPGIENSGGPLGQGLSQAVGAAIGLRMQARNNRVYAVCGDGELEEGQCWESFLLAGKLCLDNLTVIVDRNNIQIDGPADDVMPIEPLIKKFLAFRFHVMDIDGNDMQQVLDALEQSTHPRKHPLVIIARTTPGKGVSFMEKRYEWHGKAPSKEEAQTALTELSKERKRLEEGA